MKILITLDCPCGERTRDIIQALKHAIHTENVLTQGAGFLHESHVEHATNEFISNSDALAIQEKNDYLEERRPHWAKGFSSDSVSAQCYLDCVLSYQKLLNCTNNHTMAIEKLRDLVKPQNTKKHP